MFKLRNVYYFNAIVTIIFSFIFIFILPIFFSSFLKEVNSNAFQSITLGIVALLVSIFNYAIASSDKEKEKSNKLKIKQLENKLNKDQEKKDFKMKDFD